MDLRRMVLAGAVATFGWGAPGVWADSLFSTKVALNGTMVSEQKARFSVGDIITVLVNERVDASTKADTRTKKEADIEAVASAADNQFLVADGSGGLNIFNEEELPNWAIESENETRAIGSTRRQSTLTLTVACIVTQVLDNGNIVIEGKKDVTVNREISRIFVKGIVRARDVTPSNTISSAQIANATVQLQGQGPLWNNQRRGIFTKVLDWFSPF